LTGEKNTVLGARVYTNEGQASLLLLTTYINIIIEEKTMDFFMNLPKGVVWILLFLIGAVFWYFIVKYLF